MCGPPISDPSNRVVLVLRTDSSQAQAQQLPAPASAPCPTSPGGELFIAPPPPLRPFQTLATDALPYALTHLVSLRLHRCSIPPLPVGFAGFPALKELDLSDVAFPANADKQLEAIIRRSPLLQDLYMYAVYIPNDCPDSLVEAPNLQSISIIHTDCDSGWRIGNLPCLEDANIDVPFLPQNEHDYGDFLGHFANVRQLTLFLPFDDVTVPYTLPITFHNLKNLKLYMDFSQMQTILLMFTMLRSCHNLENLEIEIRHCFYPNIEANWEFLNALWTDGMCANLQIVKMFEIGWLPNEISLMKLILSKARLLCTLYVDSHPDCFDGPIIDLLKCRRASAQARVLFEGVVRQY